MDLRIESSHPDDAADFEAFPRQYARVDAACCVSGAGVIEPKNGLIEFGIDRYGGCGPAISASRRPAT
jgi:hypothetical protein